MTAKELAQKTFLDIQRRKKIKREADARANGYLRDSRLDALASKYRYHRKW